MKKPFLIIIDDIISAEILNEFSDVITSSYPSKKGKQNIFVIAAEEKETPKDIVTIFRSKMKSKLDFIVIELDKFYGFFPQPVIDWIKITFPNRTFAA